MKQIKVYVYPIELAKDNENELVETLQNKLHSDEVDAFSLKRFEELLNNDCIDIEHNYVFFDVEGKVDDYFKID